MSLRILEFLSLRRIPVYYELCIYQTLVCRVTSEADRIETPENKKNGRVCRWNGGNIWKSRVKGFRAVRSRFRGPKGVIRPAWSGFAVFDGRAGVSGVYGMWARSGKAWTRVFGHSGFDVGVQKV